MSEPRVMPDANGKCPEGYTWSSELGQCVKGAPTPSPDFTVMLKLTPRKPTETYAEALKSVAMLGLVVDRKFELLGIEPVYESVFKKKVHTAGRTVSIIVDTSEKLIEPAAKVAAELSTKYPQHASPTEWKRRIMIFQNLPLKYLQDTREGMQTILERLKRSERHSEISRAFDYLKENFPTKTLHNVDEASKHWLKAMQLLRTADFSFYAAREAADHVAFSIDKTDRLGRYHYNEQFINLPSTWNDPTIKAWREIEDFSTKEKEAWDAEDKENKKQHEALKPMLTKLIEQGMSDKQIQATLEAQKKPRQFISDLMGEVRYLRFTGVEKHKPPKIEVVMSSAKEDQPAKDPSKQVPECPEGQYWDSEQGKCVPIKPPEPEDKETAKAPEQEDTRWNKPTILSKDQIDSANKPSY